MIDGFIRCRRLPIMADIIQDRNAWSLLGAIASRARFHDGPNMHNLKIGEALVGDYKAIGFTRKEYRTALERLEHKWKQITTRSTNRGTIAKLTDLAVFDFSPLNESLTNRHTPLKGPAKGPADYIGETREKGHQKVFQEANSRPLTNNDIRKEGKNDSKAPGNSVAGEVAKIAAKSSSSFVEPYQNHIKWPEFSRWCATKKGTPTAEGFTTWLLKQKPEWRNKVKAGIEETGYVLNGKFYPSEEANQLAASNPNLALKFREATRRNGRVVLKRIVATSK